jgi:hypothetical protein
VLMAVHKDCYTSLNLTNKAAAAGGILFKLCHNENQRPSC